MLIHNCAVFTIKKVKVKSMNLFTGEDGKTYNMKIIRLQYSIICDNAENEMGYVTTDEMSMS